MWCKAPRSPQGLDLSGLRNEGYPEQVLPQLRRKEARGNLDLPGLRNEGYPEQVLPQLRRKEARGNLDLSSLLDELQRALLDNDAAGAAGLCKKARAVLAERNRICKLNQ